ncbi:MAG: ATP-binding protein [Candidatus Pseudobacter hemicellulosilyticus]|uniref:histidine kinase n=1 Tax=Candidatus Pseudobacter hemicellulosilyticus TaxID=3121375 RepID=A0AAJ5WY11_9BACT|nr:MAG: ATP-binding protein [Pseudobacter sp.]
MKCAGTLILILLYALIPVIACSQRPFYRIINYNNSNGLPQNSVKSIGFDKAGFCWLATEMGLVRFDGRNFKVYEQPQIPGLQTNRVRAILPDTDGQLLATWIDNSFVQLQQGEQHASFTPVYGGPFNGIHSRIGYKVDDAIIDSLGSLLGQEDIWEQFVLDLEDNQIVGLNRKECYVFLNDMLYYLRSGQLLNRVVLKKAKQQYLLLDSICLRLTAGNRVEAWVNGVDITGMKRVEGPLGLDPAFLRGDFRALWCTSGAYVFSGGNLYRLYVKDQRLFSRCVLPSLAIKELHAIAYDPANDCYYLGSHIDGLFIARPIIFDSPDPPLTGVGKGQNYYTQAMLDSNTVYCGNTLFSRTRAARYLDIASDQPSVLQPVGKELLYYGQTPDLCAFNVKRLEKKVLAKLDGKITGMLLWPDTSCLYVSTRNTLFRLENQQLKEKRSLPGKGTISCFVKDESNSFIIGTTKGLYWYNWPKNELSGHLLDSITIRTLHRDENNDLWIGTYDNGFYLFSNDSLTRFPYGPRNSLRSVHAFVEDGRGFFWLTTNNGLFKVSKTELLAYARGSIRDVYYYMFGKADGLPTNEFNGGFQWPYAWFADSMLSLPSLDGLVWFYPHKTKLLFPEHAIYLDKILLNNQELDKQQTSFTLAAGNNLLSLEVTSPYFGNAENILLEYTIEGIRTAWERVPADGRVVVENLPAGEQVILFRKRDGSNYTSYQQLLFRVSVAPFFYQTGWFYTVTILVLLLAVYLYLRWKTIQFRQRALLLEERVATRTSELREVVRQLADSEQALERSNRVKDQVISIVLHDLQSPIRFLDLLGKRIEKTYRQLDQSALAERLRELRNSTSTLYNFTSQFFTWAKSQHGLYAVQKRTVVIQQLFEDTATLYKDILKSRNNELIIYPTALSCYTDPVLLVTILRNLVDNAQKNTSNGVVELQARIMQEQLVISVSDTGVGMDARQINAFFEKEVDARKGGGLGGMLILDLLGKIQGRLEIESQPGAGSEFRIILAYPGH